MIISTRRILAFVALSAWFVFATGFMSVPGQPDDASPPDHVVKLIFIHHSTGENWLTDGYGDLGKTLGGNNYFVSDTNYGWGPEAIGDRTDIPNWTEWFASENTPMFMDALFNESGQNASYTRTLPDPGGENEIIMFKSCFPNSVLEGSPDDPPDPDGWLSVGHAKFVYNEILKYFAARPDKLFVVITAPPLSDSTYADNARAFNDWLLNDWLAENNYTLNNVAVFDFYNVLTSPDAHHRFNNGQVEHIATGSNVLYYPSGDDHPSVQGSQKATDEFIPLLNIFYHRWQSGGIVSPQSDMSPTESVPVPAEPQTGGAQTLGVIDDFEQGPLPGTSGWEAYFQDNADTTLSCAPDASRAVNGSNSLQFKFDVMANTWATCGIYYDSVKDWSGGQGISFYLQSDRAEIYFDVDLYGGTPGGHTTYVHGLATSTQNTNEWTLVQIPWSEILRAEWEENAGTPFNPAEVTGFSIGLSAPENSRVTGTLWLDDLALMGPESNEPPVVQPATEPAEEPAEEPAAERPSICRGAGALPLLLFGLMLWGRKRRD